MKSSSYKNPRGEGPPSRAGPPAPALARGIDVLRLLGAAGPLSLEDTARRTRVPKASLLRLLRTLERCGLVRRRENAYVAAALIVPVRGVVPGFEEMVEAALGRVATAAGMTAEWYVPCEAGMLLAKRAEPISAEVEVKARAGFLRSWTGELDAVAAVGLAMFRPERRRFSGHWTYVRDGVRAEMPARAAEERVKRAASAGYVVDRVLNPNGVRRMACTVSGPGGSGVLALAGHFAPAKAGNEEVDLGLMLAEAETLSAWSQS